MDTISSTPAAEFFKRNMYILAHSFVSQGIYYTLTFSAALVASNTINGVVGASAINQVTYGTSSDATMAAIATEIESMPGVKSADVVTVAALTTDDRVIEVVPLDQTSGINLSAWAVTNGASQATITVAQVDRRLRLGMPVELDSVNEGEVKPATAATIDLNSIGYATLNGEAGDEIAIALRGSVIIRAKADGVDITPGPVVYTGYDYVEDRNKVNQTSPTVANCYGWALEAASSGSDVMVLVKG